VAALLLDRLAASFLGGVILAETFRSLRHTLLGWLATLPMGGQHQSQARLQRGIERTSTDSEPAPRPKPLTDGTRIGTWSTVWAPATRAPERVIWGIDFHPHEEPVAAPRFGGPYNP
jgi:hypothetical protein